ncbi:MAG: hypothetical protein Rhims3KO_18260 [Hyphomicrobiales bacterium]
MDLWQSTTQADALHEAWHKVLANRGSAGGDGIAAQDFKKDLHANLTQLRAELLSGNYQSGPFRKVSIPKRKPGYRILTIPSIRDRVLHTSISNTLTPIFEPLFEDGSFAYRPNRGVQQAVARIERWRNKGYDVVIEADIVSYFDNIDHEILLEKLNGVLANQEGWPPLQALLEQLLREQARALGTPGKGLVQGSPLSPLLSNLYLDALDEEMESHSVKIVRFADDFVLLCKSQAKARATLNHCIRVLDQHDLQLHEEGTRIVSFDRGFDFIGYLFVRSLALKEDRQVASLGRQKPVKSEVTDEGVIQLDHAGSRFDPGKRVLYVFDPNHRLCVRNRAFCVQRLDEHELLAIPYKRVGRLEVGPGIQFDRAVVDLAIDGNAELDLVDGFGQMRGTLAGKNPKRGGLLLAQAEALIDQTFRIAIASKLVETRMRNQRTQLMRLARKRDDNLPAVDAALKELKRSVRRVQFPQSIEQIRGFEGAATATYWPAIADLCQHRASHAFRRTRPARDPLNASINYLTAVLERDIRAAIHKAHLHTGLAFLHGTRDRHDGLVYDLMEPFRAPLTEGLVVYLFNARRLREDAFTTDRNGLALINSDGRHAIIRGYETAVARAVNRSDGRGKLQWRAMMQHQAQTLAKAINQKDPEHFVPYLMEA